MSLSRRMLLRGAGATLALPFLPSLAGRAFAGGSASPPKRLVVFYSPNGMPPQLWTPPTTGRGWTPSPILRAIAPIREELAVVSGLSNLSSAGVLNHPAATRAVLSCTVTQDRRFNGVSFDQLIANHYAGQTPMGSLHLASDDAPCRLVTCKNLRAISWQSDHVPAPRDTSVAASYRSVFSVPDPPAGVGTADADALRGSLLDIVRSDLARYSAAADTTDGQRLEAYADALRSVEQRIALIRSRPACEVDGEPPRVVDAAYGGDDHIEAMLDLAVLALQCDHTRVVTYMLGDGSSERPLDFLGLSIGHHELSHANWDEGSITAANWTLGHFTRLVQRLADVREHDGSRLLDHTYVLFVSGMGEASQHLRDDIPVLLAGPVGPFRGQHLAVGSGTPLANLYTSMLRAFGVDNTRFGSEGTGSLVDLG